MICASDVLSALDRTLAAAYAAALKQTDTSGQSRLKAEQRGWIKGHDDCWKVAAENRATCIRDEYISRIAFLQATYRLVPARGPVRYVCGNSPADEVLVTWFQTDPASAIAERGDQTSFMLRQSVPDGVRYQGRNETLWEQQGGLKLVWGYEAPEQICQIASGPERK